MYGAAAKATAMVATSQQSLPPPDLDTPNPAEMRQALIEAAEFESGDSEVMTEEDQEEIRVALSEGHMPGGKGHLTRKDRQELEGRLEDAALDVSSQKRRAHGHHISHHGHSNSHHSSHAHHSHHVR
jgi:hypothetical protein